MTLSSSHPGYMFLVTVLVIGAMSAATAVSLMLLGWAAEQNGYLVQQTAQADEYARSCFERAVRTLRADPSYAGSETITFSIGSCFIRPVTGDGWNDRRLCIEGRSGQSVRRLEATVSELFPTVRLSSFAEVANFSLCP